MKYITRNAIPIVLGHLLQNIIIGEKYLVISSTQQYGTKIIDNQKTPLYLSNTCIRKFFSNLY